MIFADKLIRLRKKMGLSQEELAFKMNVSRQAVSKWESAQSIPDLEKILQLSTLFNVSTDYLLKDELEIEEFVGDESLVRVLTLEEVNEFLKHSKKTALDIAVGTLLCILAPLALIVLSILSDESVGFISSSLATIIGLTALFLLVVIAVIIFITTGFRDEQYTHILKEDFTSEYGVNGIVKEKRNRFRSKYNSCNLVGIVLCVLSPIALIVSSFTNNLYAISFSLALLLIMVAIAVFMFILVGTRWESYQRILHEGEYKIKNKFKEDKATRIIWLSATIVYLSVSFSFGYWHLTWIIWIIAALIQAIIHTLKKED